MGAAPGGWSQIIAQEIKSDINTPSVIAVDINHMNQLKGVKFIQGDMNKKATHDEILKENNYEKFDIICSDICPEFTGNKLTDHYNLINMNYLTKDFSFKVLKRNGHLIMKTFEGSMQKKLQTDITKYFNKIHRFKPGSSRQDSSELYLICLGYLENEELKKEAEEAMKMEPSDYLEKKKNEAIKEWKIYKFNPECDWEKLDELRNEIMQKFKTDPGKIKIDDSEENEIKKFHENEHYEFHKEFFGDRYDPRYKTLPEIVEAYLEKRKEFQEKIAKASESEKVDLKEFEEFFQADVEEKHFEEISKATLKEVDFYQKQADFLKDKVSEKEIEELLKADGSENEILQNFKRWEGYLKEHAKQYQEEQMNEIKDKDNKMKEGMVIFKFRFC
jgi:23S rRNA (uridine2552-2'-O)-methyltransferase